MSATPFVREEGHGPGVVCLHSNASSSAQWRALSELLSDRFHVLAADGYGAGKSPEWTGDHPLRLHDEVELLGPVLERAGDPFHLVGHSYGAAVAMKTALLHPQRVRSIAIYEPTLFHLVAGGDPLCSPAQGIWRAVASAAEAIERGDGHEAARHFIDFWMGEGAWAAMPPARQAAVAASARHVTAWRDALFAETAPLAAFAALDIPVLLMAGARSPESALSVAQALKDVLPRVTFTLQPGLGHMAPVTHPERINPQIAAFLDDIAANDRRPSS